MYLICLKILKGDQNQYKLGLENVKPEHEVKNLEPSLLIGSFFTYLLSSCS